MISLICSDLHGDALGAKRLVSLVGHYHPDRILLLGDLFYSGVRWSLPDTYNPEETFVILKSLADRIIAIRGNCDREEDLQKSGLICPDVRHLRNGDHILFMVHDQRTLEEPLAPGDILLSGHTHIPNLSKRDGILFANPGSLSWPRGGSKPTFMLMDEHQIVLYDCDRNVLMSQNL